MARPNRVEALLAWKKKTPHGRCGTGHDPEACWQDNDLGGLIQCDCCRGKCPRNIKEGADA